MPIPYGEKSIPFLTLKILNFKENLMNQYLDLLDFAKLSIQNSTAEFLSKERQPTKKITGIELTLRNFELHSATVGEDAQGEATVTVEFNGQSYRGNGTSQDILEAAARAYLEVINRILRRQERGLTDAQLAPDINRASI